MTQGNPPETGDPLRRISRRNGKNGLRAAAFDNPGDFFGRLPRALPAFFHHTKQKFRRKVERPLFFQENNGSIPL
jgi:hypothetical protein